MTRLFFCFYSIFFFPIYVFAASKAETLYNNSCEMCHGVSGKWDGVVGQQLKQSSPHLKDFHSLYGHLSAALAQKKVLHSLNSKDKHFLSMHEQVEKLTHKEKESLSEYIAHKFSKK